MKKIYRDSDQTKSAVLFLIFNRPDTTQLVFDRIRDARPRKLYIAADGPRPNKPDDEELCRLAKEVIEQVDWNCTIHKLYRETNLGCKESVSGAIDWFFSQEEEGIILEDDCVPTSTFFHFCDTLLEKYRHDTRIRHISGCNFQLGKEWGDASYYFSNLTHVWGWASWRRAWKDYDKNIQPYNDQLIVEELKNIFNDPIIFDCLHQVFDRVKAGKINSWAYPLTFTNFFNNSLSIIPNTNLINNVGCRGDATNTTYSEYIYANLQAKEIKHITHPKVVLPQKEADLITLSNEFNVFEKKRQLQKQNLFRYKVKRWLKSVLNVKEPVAEHAIY